MAPPTATSRQQQGKTKGRLPYPRPSWLTKAEQKLYLELYDKYMSYVPTKASATEVKEINQLKVRAPNTAQSHPSSDIYGNTLDKEYIVFLVKSISVFSIQLHHISGFIKNLKIIS